MNARYSKREVGRSGKVLISPSSSLEERAQAEEVVNYWREVHAEALQCMLDDLEQVCGSEEVLVAGRLKKIGTIEDKLKRADTPDFLPTMYDIAGCRIVVPSFDDMESLCERLRVLPNFDERKTEKRDYIAHPKPSGYRGRHLIFRYSDLPCGHDLFVELQVRTRRQHEWATAVEMYDEAAKTRLKFNEIDNVPGRFFQKASRIIEQLEVDQDVRAGEIRAMDAEGDGISAMLSALGVLEAASGSVTLLGEQPVVGIDDYCLVDLHPDVQTVEIEKMESLTALATYFDRERADADGSSNLVLVRGADFGRLKELYPNYFGNIDSFVSLMNKHLDAFA